MKATFYTALFLLVMGNAIAQTQKIGYADTEHIFTQMPDSKQIETQLKDYNSQLQAQLEAKSKEFETKYRAYQGMPATTPDAIRADKERELQLLQESIQKFQTDAQTSAQNKYNTLMEPVFTKIGKAISEVAKEHGYSFILSMGIGGSDILLFSDDKYDVSNLVLQKFGITPAAKPAAAK